MISAAYRCLTELCAPVIDMYLRRRLNAGREDAERFEERQGYASILRPAGFLIWCHAASVGEAVSLLSLIDAMRERMPSVTVLITTGTVTSARMLEGRLPEGVFHQYVPVDRLPFARRFLDHWHPDLVLWVESELWPNLLQEVKQRSIPAILLNGRMSDKSFRQWYRLRSFAKEILGTFSLCLTQTEAERGRFVTLGARPVRCIGNLKYAASPLPYDPAALEYLRIAMAGSAVWLMASTHRGEEEIAAEVHKKLKASRPNLLTIIVPRHAARGDEIAARLTALGLRVARRSKGDVMTTLTAPMHDIYLADTMGELGLFYRLVPIVAIGNSFTEGATGGHNPIEPAQLGAALIFGPSMYNFAEVTREFLFRRAAVQLQHANELAFTVNRLLTNSGEREDFARNAVLLANEKRHVLVDILDQLAPWLEKAAPPAQLSAPR